MSRKQAIAVGVVLALTTVLVGTARALSNISFTTGTIESYDFGSFGPGYPVRGTIQIQAFKLKPGDTIPWHYHKGTSYVILSSGVLTEQHAVGAGQCESEQLTAGSAFVEPPGLIHNVTNTGGDAATIWWATIFPESDGIAQFTPAFSSGGVYPANVPNCN